LLKEKGIINIGGRRQTIYSFAKKSKPKIKPMLVSKKIKKLGLYLNSNFNEEIRKNYRII